MDSGVWMWAWSAVGGAWLARAELRQCGRDLSVMTVWSARWSYRWRRALNVCTYVTPSNAPKCFSTRYIISTFMSSCTHQQQNLRTIYLCNTTLVLWHNAAYHYVSLAMSHSLIHLPPAHHSHPPSHPHCFIPGSKLTFSTNLFPPQYLLAPSWTAFSDNILDRTYSAQRFFIFSYFSFFLFFVVR